MTSLADYARLEQELKALQERLQSFQTDENFQKELEFKDKLEQLLEEFDKKPQDVIEVLDPDGSLQSSASTSKAKPQNQTGTRRKRKLKVYKNPHTGNVIETRGGNHKELKEWKEEYGADEVESWLQETA